MPAILARTENKKDVTIVQLVEDQTEKPQEEQQNVYQKAISMKNEALEWTSSLVLTKSQRDKAANSFPIVFYIVAGTCITNYSEFGGMFYAFWLKLMMIPQVWNIFYPLFVLLFLGVPLEIAHGRLKMFFLILTTSIYSLLLGYYDYGSSTITNRFLFSYDVSPVLLSLFAVYFSNIIWNWKEMNHKVLRVIILLILLPQNQLVYWKYAKFKRGWFDMVDIVIGVSCLNGLIFGHFLFYGNRKPGFKCIFALFNVVVIILTIIHHKDSIF